MVISFNPYCVAKLYVPLKWPSTECPSTCFHIDRATTIFDGFPPWNSVAKMWASMGRWRSRPCKVFIFICPLVLHESQLWFLSTPNGLDASPNHEVQRVQPPIWAHQSLMIFSKLQKCSKYQRHEPTGLVRVDPAKELTNKAVMG